MNPTVAAVKAVTRKSIQITTSQRVRDLKEIKLKKNTQKKSNWGVAAYNRWRNERLNNFNYDPGVYFADINDLAKLEKANFVHAMTFFLAEINKESGDLFPRKTLYHMVTAIQKHLQVNKINWKLIDDPDCVDIKIVLDNLMKERMEMGLGTEKKRAEIITTEIENDLWECKFLDSENPIQLQRTVYFGLGMQCILRSVQDHHSLRRWTPTRNSQLTFERNSDGIRCLVYREDYITKTHNGGLADMKHDRKEVVIVPNSNTS